MTNFRYCNSEKVVFQVFKTILVHYSEIGTKGENRPFFEKRLIENIQNALSSLDNIEVKRFYGHIIINLSNSDDMDNAVTKLCKVPGIANISPCLVSPLDISSIKEKLMIMYGTIDKNAGTFRITARRSNKNFPLTSQEISRELGSCIVKENSLKVDLTSPDVNFQVEITEQGAYLYTQKISGIGGLPVGVNGKLVALISGGIDSPVAAYRMLSRGCSVILVHFYNQQQGVIDKIESLANIIAEYQHNTILYTVPFVEIQRKLIMHIPAKVRMIVYRRVMFEIANRILRDHKGKGFVTGDSLGQVASQTPENIRVIWNKAKWPVFAPLIGDDKEMIITEAKKLGTYDISILPYSDCCSFNIAPHPETRGDLATIEKLEEHLDIESEVRKALDTARKNVKRY